MAGAEDGGWLLQYARAMEEDGRHLEAAAEFERAGDVEAAVRLYLSPLNNTNKAFALTRRSGSVAAATIVARHCSNTSSWAGAVEFGVRARDFSGAWQIAQTHREMDEYAAALDANAPPEMHAQVAVYFQNVKEHAKAAAQYEAAGNMLSAVSQLMAHSKRVRGYLWRCSPAACMVHPTSWDDFWYGRLELSSAWASRSTSRGCSQGRAWCRQQLCIRRCAGISCGLADKANGSLHCDRQAVMGPWVALICVGVQVDGSERDDVTKRALEIVAAAPQEEARRMAHMVMSSVDQHDHDRFAEQFVELNLALGNREAALAAVVNAALAEQRRGSYKARPAHCLRSCYSRTCWLLVLNCSPLHVAQTLLTTYPCSISCLLKRQCLSSKARYRTWGGHAVIHDLTLFDAQICI